MKTAANVVILAGGKGTRLASRAGNLPKPMVPILGKPVLQYQIELCKRFGFTEIALLVHHRHQQISNFFGDGSDFGVNLAYSIESEPRGTAGALRDALHMLADRFLVLYGDTFIDVDLRKLWEAHEFSRAVGTLFLHPNDHPHDSDLVEVDAGGAVRAILPYPHPSGREVPNLVNAALYVLDRDGLEDVTPTRGSEDIAKHMFPRMLELGRSLYGYVSPEYVKDMGTPERLDRVERDFVAGLPERLSVRQPRSAVFLDRDGTINRDVTHLKSPGQIELLPGVAGAIRRLNLSGMLAVVITNQPVVARGDVTPAELNRIHNRLQFELGVGGAFLDGIYICPHHPDKGFPGEIPELKIPCKCRKPQSGLIDQACSDLGIGRQKSWMVGDTTSDVEAGRRAGLRTILLRSGHAGADAKCAVRPDYSTYDLADAIDWILRGHADLTCRVAPIAVAIGRNARLVLVGGLARAGKSFVAQVLKELLHVLGREAHVIALDGWPNRESKTSDRVDGFDHFDFAAAAAAIRDVARSNTRVVLTERLSGRLVPNSSAQCIDHSVGPDDVLILEGVAALAMSDLLDLSGVIKVHVNVAPNTRETRLRRDFSRHDVPGDEQIGTAMTSLALDDISTAEQSRLVADFVVEVVSD